ncbi:MAG: protein BatD [Rhodanobacter sp.]|nr:MAG: protein BatD [Rhodanobacter sp.]TAL93024.1 MAG: protein BatD [Rhodanobacter sp.]TAM41940.1 MAG: protein BatD [Rhodanobacter sp.]TAN29229.1 MAG: protein BatD [Rhodanobacter sp.]
MRFVRAVALCLLAVLLVPAAARAAKVTATLDRSQVQLGDTVTLNVRVEGAGGNVAMPDLSALTQDFDVLGTSQNNSLSVVNGHATSSLTFGVALRPKHVGTLQIPALKVVGEQTAPLQLEVSAPSPAASAAPNRDVFMEARVEPPRGYVGEQFSYVVKLFYANALSGGSIDVPNVGGADLSQLGKDLSYDTQRGGRSYHVLERRYSLIPQQAGHIQIPATSFQGNAIDPSDPNSFFGATDNVSASAPAVAIDVQAAPSNWGNNAWLPARALSLSLEGWPGAQRQVRVGQPLNLTMALQATGLSDDALPALSLPPLDGATAYPDKPVSHNHVDGPWISGQREQSFAIVPERAGTLTIPATTLKWWNVLTDKMEEAQIPAHSITVLPAIGGNTVMPSVPAATAATAPASVVSNAPAATNSSTPWRWIALGSIALWLFSMLAWWLQRRRGRGAAPIAPAPAPAPATTRQAQLAFLAAARGSDVASQVRCLLAWARAERPSIQHLGELSAALEDASQRAAIDALQQRHYAGVPTPSADTGVELVAAFKGGFVWRSASSGEGDSGLPPLYPFKLH